MFYFLSTVSIGMHEIAQFNSFIPHILSFVDVFIILKILLNYSELIIYTYYRTRSYTLYLHMLIKLVKTIKLQGFI